MKDAKINNTSLFFLVFIAITIKPTEVRRCAREVTKCRFKKAS